MSVGILWLFELEATSNVIFLGLGIFSHYLITPLETDHLIVNRLLQFEKLTPVDRFIVYTVLPRLERPPQLVRPPE